MGSPPAANKPSNQTFPPNAVDTCFALVAHQATNKPSNQIDATLCDPTCCRYLVRIAGEALRPPPHPVPRTPSRLYLHSIHLCIHPRPPLSTDHPSIKQASNQQTKQPKPRNPVSPKCCRYLVCIAGKALRPPPHPVPPICTQHPSIHPSMIHPSLYVFSPNPSNQQAKQAEPTDAPTKGRRVKRKGG